MLLGISNSYKCNPNGVTGASERVLFNISRTNLGGTDQSITLRTNYGSLEQIALLSYQDPHVLNKPSLNLTLSGGYNNSAVISTYKASILSGALRLSQRVTKPTTLIYSFSYRRVVGEFHHPASQPVGDSLASAAGAGGRPGNHLYSRYPRRTARCAPWHLQHRGSLSLPMANSARKPTSTASTSAIPPITTSAGITG